MLGTRLEYPLSPRYVPDWTIVEALRELIANALDTSTDPTVTWEYGTATISDRADGIPRAFWVIGEGDHGEIGQFGEGLKMAMLVLARERRATKVRTVGYTVSPSMVMSSAYATTVLALDFEETPQETGTRVEVRCDKAEFDAAKMLFLKFNGVRTEDHRLGILAKPGALFINGVFVQGIKSLWGYNVKNKDLANRDRTILDGEGVKREIENALGHLRSERMLTTLFAHGLISSNSNQIEMCVNPKPQGRTCAAWRKVFIDLFGKSACVTALNSGFNTSIQGLGWRVVTLPWGISNALRNCGIMNSSEALESMQGKKFVQVSTENPLTPKEQSMFEAAKAIAKNAVPDSKVKLTKVVEEFPTDNQRCMTEGMYRATKNGGTIFLRRTCLDSLEKSVGVLIHERLHGLGHSDESRGFEYAMTMMLGEMAVANA